MRKIAEYAGYIVTVGVTALLMYSRYTNPDMTDVRFFLEFWKEYVVGLVAFFGGMALIAWGK